MPTDPWLVLGAVALEGAVGYPAVLAKRLPHPVVWVGRLIAILDRSWNRKAWSAISRRLTGVVAIAVVIASAVLVGWALQRSGPVLSTLLVVVCGSTGLAQRSLFQHVDAVRRRLEAGDLVEARRAVGAIVGRDVDTLDEAGIASAALESLAESFNDGVAAPLFWFLIAGLPGLFAYKAVNTADSMIGHLEPRWRAFGWAAARTDDLMNLIPARIAGMLLCLVGRGGWTVMWRDAGRHASPNSGWPEAAMAGVLNVKLGGAVSYDRIVADRAVLGVGPAPTVRDVRRGLTLYVAACGLLWLLLALGGFAWPR